MVHDWTRVEAGIFHAFHHVWIADIQRALNAGLLQPDYYALSEQIAGGIGPDVLTLQAPAEGVSSPGNPAGGLALETAPPRVRFHQRAEGDKYAAKAKAVTIRHTSNHRVIAILEIVSPGNKNTRHAVSAFVSKAVGILRSRVHLLVIDLFAPGPRDPRGIHKLVWDEFIDNDFALPAEQPLSLAAYLAGDWPEAFIEPVAVAASLPDMPLFLTPEIYVPVPLEATYESAWETVPAYWQRVLTAPR